MSSTDDQNNRQQMPSATGLDAQTVLNRTAAGLCVVSADGRIVDANPAFAGLVCAAAPLVGASFETFVHVEDRLAFATALAGVQNDAPWSETVSIRLQPRGVDPFWTLVSLGKLHNTDALSDVVMQLQTIDGLMQMLATLQKNETRWKFALESAHQGVWDHDFQQNDLFYSATWRTLRGLPPDCEVDGSLDTWIESVHPDDRAHVLERIRQQDDGDVTFNTFQYRERHADGHWVWIESRGASIEWGPDGKPSRIIGTDTDVTEHKRAEARLAELSRKLQLALDVSQIGVFDFNLDTGEALWDERMLQIYGLDRPGSRYAPTDWERMLHPEDREVASSRVKTAVETQRPFTNAFRIVLEDGEVRSIRSNAAPYVDPDGARRLIGANWDVTADVAMQDQLARANMLAEARNRELEAARIRIEYNALHDHLTGLPNRRFLDQRLDDLIAGRLNHSAILHIDLDRFKQINDTLGHQAGDVMLIHTANTLSLLAGTDDFVARIGGDEFVILCGAQRGRSDVVELTDAIIAALRQPVPYEGHLCRFGASVGIAWTDESAGDARQSLMNADIALYRAKGLGRNRYEFFTTHLQTQIHHAKKTADEIMKGLEENEFVPFYQPQFCARSLDITGVETLARWIHPLHGLRAPDYFLKVAEDINALSTIDQRIAEHALADFADWRDRGLGIPRLSVNVSARRLREPGLIESLKALQIAPGILSFELLESIFLDDLEDSVAETIASLKSLGIDIEIDDFGTGHASIVGLLKLSPSRLKIDRALVKPITDTTEQRRLVGAIIDIGHSLNIEVIAEGVETFAHAHILRELGCDILQGYAFARPMTKQDLETFVISKAWRPATVSVQALQQKIRKDWKA